MTTRNDLDELQAAWHALAKISDSQGWKTITIGTKHCPLRAGRYYPVNTEALLIGFFSVPIPPVTQLPQGQGFSVSTVHIPSDDLANNWIALSRQDDGNPDLFKTMAVDLIGMLKGFIGFDENQRLHAFLTRIKAWQDFMSRGGKGVLGLEAETGLFGELIILQNLLDKLPASVAVDAWQGPLGGVQDFLLGTGAVECKTTIQPQGFQATIGTLDQLDDTHIRPLFIAAIRLTPDSSGLTLPEQATLLHSRLALESTVRSIFDSRLFHAGLFDANDGQYFRRFLQTGFRMFRISDEFPRLVRENVPIGIQKACYQIDLDRINSPDIELDHALQQLGMI